MTALNLYKNINGSDFYDTALANIQENFKIAASIVQQLNDLEKQLEDSEGDVTNDQNRVADLETAINNCWDAILACPALIIILGPVIGGLEIDLNNAKNARSSDSAKVATIVKQMTDLTATLKSLFPNNDLISNVCNEIDSVLNKVNNLLNNLQNAVSGAQLQKDMQLIQEIMQTYISALTDNLRIAADEAAQEQPDCSDADFYAYALDAIAAASHESDALTNLQGDLNKAHRQYYSDSDNAAEDANNIHWTNYLPGVGQYFNSENPFEQKEVDEATQANAKAMMDLLSEVIGDAECEKANLLPQQMGMFEYELKEILRRIRDILLKDPGLTNPSDSAEVLELFVMATSIISSIMGFVMKEKGDFEKEMASAALTASMEKATHQQMLGRELEDNLKYAAIMKVVMVVAEVVAGIIAFILAPEGALGFIALLFVLLAVANMGMTLAHKQNLNEMASQALATAIKKDPHTFMLVMEIICPVLALVDSQLQESLEDRVKKDSQLAADIIIGAVEIAFSVGGSMGLTKLLKVTVETDLIAAEKAAAVTIENATKEAAQTAVADLTEKTLTGGLFIEQAAKDETILAIKTTAKAAAELAAKQTAQDFSQLNLFGMMSRAIQGQTREVLMTAAAKEAAQTAATAVQKAVVEFGQIGEYTQSFIAQCNKIAEDSAKVAVKNVLKFTATQAAVKTADTTAEETTKSLADKIRSGFGKAKEAVGTVAKSDTAKGLALAAYAIGTTNFLCDIATVAQRRAGEKKLHDEEFEQLMAILGGIQQLLQVFAMGISSASSVASLLEDSTNLTKGLTAGQALGSGGTLIGSLGQGESLWKQGDTTKALMVNQAELAILDYVMKRLNDSSNQESARDADDITSSLRTTMRLAGHLHDNDNALASALAGTAV